MVVQASNVQAQACSPLQTIRMPAGAQAALLDGQSSTVMNGSVITTQDQSKSSCLEQDPTEQRFLEQFAALEDSLALLQIEMRRMSESAKLLGSLALHIRRSACPALASGQEM